MFFFYFEKKLFFEKKIVFGEFSKLFLIGSGSNFYNCWKVTKILCFLKNRSRKLFS